MRGKGIVLSNVDRRDFTTVALGYVARMPTDGLYDLESPEGGTTGLGYRLTKSNYKGI